MNKLNLSQIFDKLTSNEIVITKELKQYSESLYILLDNYFCGIDEVFYKTDSYGIGIEILDDPSQDCFLSYLNSLGDNEEYNEEDFEMYQENYFCYVSSLSDLLNNLSND